MGSFFFSIVEKYIRHKIFYVSVAIITSLRWCNRLKQNSVLIRQGIINDALPQALGNQALICCLPLGIRVSSAPHRSGMAQYLSFCDLTPFTQYNALKVPPHYGMSHTFLFMTECYSS